MDGTIHHNNGGNHHGNPVRRAVEEVAPELFRKPEPRPGYRWRGSVAVPISGWKPREDFVETCIYMGLNLGQIAQLSLVTPQRFADRAGVSRYLRAHSLEEAYQEARPRRLGEHNKAISSTYQRFAGFAYLHGCTLTDIERDRAPEGERFRPDWTACVDGRLNFAEIQLSKLRYVRWREKFLHYFKFYMKHRRPFRALFLVNTREELEVARARARDVLQARPTLNIFYFLTLAEYESHPDILRGPAWLCAWHDDRRFTLV